MAATLTHAEMNLTPDWLKREEQAYAKRKKVQPITDLAEEPVTTGKRLAQKKGAILVGTPQKSM